MIEIIEGNLFDTQCDIIGHGVNCQGKMGSGVAKEIRRRFPEAYNDYIHKFRNTGWKVGETQLVRTSIDQPRFIANMATQVWYGYDNKTYIDYRGIRNCLFDLLVFCTRENYSVAIPRIGAGLGGGDWDLIFKIIEHESLLFPDVLIEIYSLSERQQERKK